MKIYKLLFVLYLPLVILAQPFELQWSQRYNGEHWEQNPTVVERPEGGFALVYETTSTELGDLQIRFLLTDTLGNIEFDHSYGGVENELVRDLRVTSDGGYLLSASTGSYGPTNQLWSGWLIKTNSSGDSVWSRVFNNSNHRHIQSAVESGSNLYALLRRQSMRAGFDIIKLSSDGDSLEFIEFGEYLLGDTVYEYGDTMAWPKIDFLIPLQNGDIIGIGDTYTNWWIDSANGNVGDASPLWLLRFDQELNSIFQTMHFDNLIHENICPAIEANNGNLHVSSSIFVHGTNPPDVDANISTFSADGDFLWSRSYGNNFLSYPLSAALTPDGGILLAGEITHDGWDPLHNWLCKISANGDSVWSYDFGETDRYRHQSIAATRNGGYILAATRMERSEDEWNWLWDIELFRFSPEQITAIGTYPIGIPQKITLNAFPNPFNAVTTLSVELPQAGDATINVYDVQGRLVRTLVNDYLLPGSHRFSFNGSDIGSGAYFVRVNASQKQVAHRIVLLK